LCSVHIFTLLQDLLKSNLMYYTLKLQYILRPFWPWTYRLTRMTCLRDKTFDIWDITVWAIVNTSGISREEGTSRKGLPVVRYVITLFANFLIRTLTHSISHTQFPKLYLSLSISHALFLTFVSLRFFSLLYFLHYISPTLIPIPSFPHTFSHIPFSTHFSPYSTSYILFPIF
jgi:hypothetical protein